MLSSNLFKFLEYLKPFRRYEQNKFECFLQCTKSPNKIFQIFYIFDKKYCKIITIQDKLVLIFLAES